MAALAAPALSGSEHGPLRSFTYVFDELESCDERTWVEELVERYGLEPDYFYGIGMRPPLQEEQYDARRINTGFGIKRALDAKKRLVG